MGLSGTFSAATSGPVNNLTRTLWTIMCTSVYTHKSPHTYYEPLIIISSIRLLAPTLYSSLAEVPKLQLDNNKLV
jgi:hypothetical protein